MTKEELKEMKLGFQESACKDVKKYLKQRIDDMDSLIDDETNDELDKILLNKSKQTYLEILKKVLEYQIRLNLDCIKELSE